jgi:hypothetical protein
MGSEAEAGCGLATLGKIRKLFVPRLVRGEIIGQRDVDGPTSMEVSVNALIAFLVNPDLACTLTMDITFQFEARTTKCWNRSGAPSRALLNRSNVLRCRERLEVAW